MLDKIQVSVAVNANKTKTYTYYTSPEHIVQWNFADPSWQCPSATNDMQVGGIYRARMEAKDGSFGFDFEAVYSQITVGEQFTYSFGDRLATVTFTEAEGQTTVTIDFDPETENPVALQQQGWQAILNNFKTYTEAN